MTARLPSRPDIRDSSIRDGIAGERTRMVDWTKGRNEAQAITEPWTRQGGPGGAIVLFDRDGVRESASGGFAVIEHRLPFTPDTQNRLASISKHICAVLLLREGVPLEETLGSFIPELPETLGAVPLLDLALGIEQANLRVRKERWGPRTLDIDILDYDGLSIHTDELTIPHPRMKARAFVLMPLIDVAPGFRIEGRALSDWLSEADSAGIEIADDSRDWWRHK